MPRSNWKGVISFGLVNIPVILHTSEDTSEKISFHQIDKKNNARIKYQRINSETGKEVPWENIIKGYEYKKDIILPVEEGDLQKVVGENARTIAIETFVDKKSIHFIDVIKTYYLTPDKKGEKGYVILREALSDSKKIGIAKVIISTKEYIAAVGCYENALVLYLLHYPNEIRSLSEYDIPADNLKKYKVTAQEIKVAKQLISSMSSSWRPEKYKDEYPAMVHKWAEAKIKHIPLKAKAKRAVSSQKEVNFIELMKKSLGKAKKEKPKRKMAHPISHAKSKHPHAKRSTVH